MQLSWRNSGEVLIGHALQVPEPDGTTAVDHAASASTATPAAERNTVSLATLLEIVTCPVTKVMAHRSSA